MRRTMEDYRYAIKILNRELSEFCTDPDLKATCGTDWGYVSYHAYGYHGLHYKKPGSPGECDVFSGDGLSNAVDKIWKMADALQTARGVRGDF